MRYRLSLFKTSLLLSLFVFPSFVYADFWDDINPITQIGNLIDGKLPNPLPGIPPVLIPGGQFNPLPGGIGTPTLPNPDDFISPPLVPTIRDVMYDNLTCAQVRLKAYIGTQGTPDTVAFFEWGNTASLGRNTTSQIIPPPAANIDETLTAQKDGLVASTTYYFRAYAKNALFDEKGDIHSFIFPRCPVVPVANPPVIKQGSPYQVFLPPGVAPNNGGGSSPGIVMPPGVSPNNGGGNSPAVIPPVTIPPTSSNNGGGGTVAVPPVSPTATQGQGGPASGGLNQPNVVLLNRQFVSGGASTSPPSQQLASLHISLTAIPYTGEDGPSPELLTILALIAVSLCLTKLYL